MSARANILAKLNAASRTVLPEPETQDYFARTNFPWRNDLERLAHWAATMRRFKAEIIWVNQANLGATLSEWLNMRGLQHALLPGSPLGKTIQAALKEADSPYRGQCTLFENPIDDWKDALFNEFDVGVSTVRAGIAKTGTLILIPTPEEPRSLSLVPPIHVAIFDVQTLYNDFYSAMTSLHLADAMPTNVVLISSPSKTSDIQLTLAFGAHGPRELIILALLPEDLTPLQMEQAVADYEERSA